MKYVRINLNKPIKHTTAGKGDIKDHIHLRRIMPDFEIMLMNAGTLYMYQTQEYILKQNEVLIQLPHVEHWGSRPSSGTFHWFHFIPASYSVTDDCEASLSQGEIILPMQFKVHKTHRLTLLISHLAQYCLIPETNLIRDSLCKAILADLYMQSRINTQTNAVTQRLTAIHEYIYDHAGLGLTVEDLSLHFNYNPKYLCRIFKSYFHYTPKECITQRKMEISAYLLTNTDYTIEHIALSLGYNAQYFLRLFKQTFSMSPTNYRNAFCSPWEKYRRT